MTNELARREVTLPALPTDDDERSVDEVIAQVRKVEELMRRAMKPGIHYGRIPGVDKPTLLKAGGEFLLLLFRLSPKYTHAHLGGDIGGGGHLTIESTCTLSGVSGRELGSGTGLCSTREQKYGKRMVARTCPTCRAPAIIKGKAEYGGGWICFRKKGGCGEKFSALDESITSQIIGEIDNPNLPDTYNTVTKMADKRALIASVLNSTAASGIFTQDVDNSDERERDRDEEEHPPAPPTPPAPAPPAPPRPAPSEDEEDERAALNRERMELSSQMKWSMADRRQDWATQAGAVSWTDVDVAVLRDYVDGLRRRVSQL